MGVGDVGVDLGRADVGVAEHGLDAAEVGAVHEEVGGERVAQSVWSDVFGDAGEFGVVVDDALDAAGSETAEVTGRIDGVEMARVVEKEGGEGIASDCEIVTSGLSGGFADKNRTVFFAFATDNELAAVEVDTIAVQTDKFGNAKAAREEEFDDGAVAKARLGVARDGV